MVKNCRLSNLKLKKIFDFGKQPLGNGFLKKKNFNKEFFFRMEIGFCMQSKLVQLIKQPPPKMMFHSKYPFFSSLSKNMQKHFEKTANQIYLKYKRKKNNFFIIELGSNDGIFLEYFRKNKIKHLGIEPAKNVATISKNKKIQTLNKFFDDKCANEIVKNYGKADIFFSANVICHIPNITKLSKNIKKVLNKDGYLIFEDPYLGDIVKKGSYDQIYDEHVFFFSIHSVRNIFKKIDMTLIDALPQTTHGGSMRYIIKNSLNAKTTKNLDILLKNETKLGITSLKGFTKLSNKIKKSKKDLLKILKNLKKNGKSVAGYAATSKSTTILNYCKIKSDLIPYINDTTPLKIGKFSPGMHIPIKSYEKSKKTEPDYYILFAWNHIKEILKKERNFIKKGGKFITHIPKVKIIK